MKLYRLTAAIGFFLICWKLYAVEITVTPWQPEFQGISLAQATFSSSVAYVDRIDLTAPGVGFFTTPHSGPLDTIAQTTSQFLQSSGVQ